MQDLIRREFAGYTIIAVVHHLENILDFDKIAVFDTRMLVEFGAPEELLGRASAFGELYGRGNVGNRVAEVKRYRKRGRCGLRGKLKHVKSSSCKRRCIVKHTENS